MLTVGSLFSGIGGIDLGLERTGGFEVKFQVEIDDYCNKVLAKHWPNVQRFRDVREVGKHNLPAVDLIAGGFPCQPHSVAGKRRGAADDRNLWPEFNRIVAEIKPRYVIAENVPGIVTTYIDQVLSDLEAQGYTWWPFIIPALAFDAGHLRYRVYIVAHTGCQREGVEGSGLSREHFDSQKENQWSASRDRFTNIRQDVAHSSIARGGGLSVRPGRPQQEDTDTYRGREVVEYADNQRREEQCRPFTVCEEQSSLECASWWETERQLRGVPDGLSTGVERHRIARLKALGNSVVPQVITWIGERILTYENSLNS